MVDMVLFICATCQKKKKEHLFCAISEDEKTIHCPYCGEKGNVHSFEGT